MGENYKNFKIDDDDIWHSDDPAVNNVLHYLKIRQTASLATRRNFLFMIDNLCSHVNMHLCNLLRLERIELQQKIQNFIDTKVANGVKKRTANKYLEILKTVTRLNGYNNEEKGCLKFETYRVPSRIDVDEYIPEICEAIRMADRGGSLRNTLAIYLCAFSGLRNSDARALRFHDFMEELEKGIQIPIIKIKLYLKQRVPNACKGGIEYYTFLPPFATEVLRLLIEEHKKKKQLGSVESDDYILMTSDRKIPLEKRRKTPMSARELQQIVKHAARRAGIKEWQKVRVHSLRKTFESVLHSPLQDKTNLHEREIRFAMGHIIGSGSEDNYFDRTKIERLRERFAKLSFAGMEPEESRLLRLVAEMLEIDIDAIIREREEQNGRSLSVHEREELIRKVIKDSPNKGSESYEQKVIPFAELEKHMNDGWEYVDSPKEDSVVVKRLKLEKSHVNTAAKPSPKFADSGSEHNTSDKTKNLTPKDNPEKETSTEDFSEHKPTDLKHNNTDSTPRNGRVNGEPKHGPLDDFL